MQSRNAYTHLVLTLKTTNWIIARYLKNETLALALNSSESGYEDRDKLKTLESIFVNSTKVTHINLQRNNITVTKKKMRTGPTKLAIEDLLIFEGNF